MFARPRAASGHLLFDVLAARHGVPHAGAREDVHVVDDDEGLLFQGDDGEVVLVRLLVAVGVVPGPHGEQQRQRPVLPAAHLRDTNTPHRPHTSLLKRVGLFTSSLLLCSFVTFSHFLSLFRTMTSNLGLAW